MRLGKVTARDFNRWAKDIEIEREWLKANGRYDFLRCEDCGTGLGALYVKLWKGNRLAGGLCIQCAQARIAEKIRKEGSRDGT